MLKAFKSLEDNCSHVLSYIVSKYDMFFYTCSIHCVLYIHLIRASRVNTADSCCFFRYHVSYDKFFAPNFSICLLLLYCIFFLILFIQPTYVPFLSRSFVFFYPIARIMVFLLLRKQVHVDDGYGSFETVKCNRVVGSCF